MTLYRTACQVLACDGCDQQLEDGKLFRTAMEARAAGYAAGWRFPPQLTSSGRDAVRASDVCPSCLPTWRPQGITRRAGYQRLDGSMR